MLDSLILTLNQIGIATFTIIIIGAGSLIIIGLMVVCAWFSMFGIEMAFNLWELIQRKTRRPF